MVDVLFFSYRSTDPWWQYLAEQLHFTNKTVVVSDMRGDGTLNIVDDFYQHLRTRDCAAFAVKQCSEIVCHEIIRRCRVLRNLDPTTALSMIGAMWITLDRLIKQQQPKLAVSFIIDRYTMDVFDRVLKANNIPFIGLTASIIPDQVMFMNRGQLIFVRKPELDEIQLAKKRIVNESFTPSYVNLAKKFNRRQYWRTFIAFKLRGLVYQWIRHVKRDRLNLHYLDALNYLEHKPRLGDYRVLNDLDHDWQSKLQAIPRNKRVFIGLQLLPEASLDYWLSDLSLLNNEEVIVEICTILGQAGFTVLIKDHPLQFGFRKRALMQQLKNMPSVILLPYHVPATVCIQDCAITVTMTGTIGFQSAVAGACSIVSGAYYSNEKNFIHIRQWQDIASLPEKIAAFLHHQKGNLDDADIDELLTNLLAASAPGDLFSFKQFNKNNPNHVQRTKTLVESLNRYLPQFI